MRLDRSVRSLRSVLIGALALALAAPAGAAEIGHFIGGLINIRDYLMPEPGVYAIAYNYFYRTDRLNDGDGDEIDSVNIAPGGGPGVTLNVDLDVDLYAFAPALIWVSPWKLLGAHYGALVLPSFANTAVSAALGRAGRAGLQIDDEQFVPGDLFVQPLWLGWNTKHFDATLGYGFYAPTGRYDVDRYDLPIVGTVKAEEADNVGLGFWTHQFQSAGSFYPFENRATAFVGAVTYEIHDDKQHFDLTPGQDVTLNWGISQYLPLSPDQKLLLEIGPAGYSTWQTTEDDGDDARNDNLDEVHAVGGQAGITYVPWALAVNFHLFEEFESEDRPQGRVVGFSLAKKFR